MNQTVLPSNESESALIARTNDLLGLQVAPEDALIEDLDFARQLAILACNNQLLISDTIRQTVTHIRVLNCLERYEDHNGASLESHQTDMFDKVVDFVANPPVTEDGQVIRAGHVISPTRTGKTAVFSKIVDAVANNEVAEGEKTRVLILVPRRFLVNQTIGEEGLEKFAPDVDVSRFFGDHKDLSGDAVVMTYQSFVARQKANELDKENFGVVVLDEVHRGLGKKTMAALEEFIEDKIAIGLTATGEFSVDKKVANLLPYEIARTHLREAIDNGLTAPVRSLIHTTDVEIPEFDPNHPDFTERELVRLAHTEARNKAIIDYACSFVANGRRGIVGCVPGYNLAHAKHIAERISQQVITDKYGVTRPVRAAWIGGIQSESEQEKILEAFETGDIDVLTHVQLLTEGLTTHRASFYINGCPMTSPVKLEQSIGRVLGIRDDGLEAILVDFLDKTVGKQQVTVLNLLGEEIFDMTKVIGDHSQHDSHEERVSYLRGILSPDLLAKLRSIDGKPIRDILLGAKIIREQSDELIDLQNAWEKRLSNEGMPAELGTDTMGLPVEYIQAFLRAYKQARENQVLPDDESYYYHRDVGPTLSDIYEYMERDRTKLGLRKGDDAIPKYVENSAGLQVMNGLPTTHFEDGLGFEESVSDVSDETLIDEDAAADILSIARNSLNEREFAVLCLRYGLDGKPPKTLEEVADEFGVTSERIRQIEMRLLARLRHPDIANKSLRSFLYDGGGRFETVPPKQPTRRNFEMKRGQAIRRAIVDREQVELQPYPYHTRTETIARQLASPVDPETQLRILGQIDLMLETVGFRKGIVAKDNALRMLEKTGVRFRMQSDEINRVAWARLRKKIDDGFIQADTHEAYTALHEEKLQLTKQFLKQRLYKVRKTMQEQGLPY